MSKTFAEAVDEFLVVLAEGRPIPITKRTTWDMAFDFYLPEGWRIHKSEGRTVVLIWPHEGVPS
jgi:hypothetical protein